MNQLSSTESEGTLKRNRTDRVTIKNILIVEKISISLLNEPN